MEAYVQDWEHERIISNYYQYYNAFTESGIVELHEGNVSWIMPVRGAQGPAMAFRVHLEKSTAEKELQKIVEGDGWCTCLYCCNDQAREIVLAIITAKWYSDEK